MILFFRTDIFLPRGLYFQFVWNFYLPHNILNLSNCFYLYLYSDYYYYFLSLVDQNDLFYLSSDFSYRTVVIVFEEFRNLSLFRYFVIHLKQLFRTLYPFLQILYWHFLKLFFGVVKPFLFRDRQASYFFKSTAKLN